MDAMKRYEETIKKLKETKEIWGLKNQGDWAVLHDIDQEYFPIWATKADALLCAADEWDGYEADTLSLEDFVSEWLPELEAASVEIAVHWDLIDFVNVTVKELREDLEKK